MVIGYVENGIVNTSKNAGTNGHVKENGNIETKSNVNTNLSVEVEMNVDTTSVYVQTLGGDLDMQSIVKKNG